jgi:transcriptional regulator GlxA family with amidase domain
VHATWIASVLTGDPLASVGLPKGCAATAHWAYARYLEDLGAHYVQKRWMARGTIVNAAGVSASIDMVLYLVSRLTDEETARTVQWLIHYDPQPTFGRID